MACLHVQAVCIVGVMGWAKDVITERRRRRTAKGSAGDSAARSVVDRVEIIARVLQSLEYENAKKVEDDIIKRLQNRFDVPRALALPRAAQEFAARTSAEEFLGEVLRLLGPYVGMLRDIYRLLEQFRATESGTAEALRIAQVSRASAMGKGLPRSRAGISNGRTPSWCGWSTTPGFVNPLSLWKPAIDGSHGLPTAFTPGTRHLHSMRPSMLASRGALHRSGPRIRRPRRVHLRPTPARDRCLRRR